MTTMASASVFAPLLFVLLDCDVVVRLWPRSQAYIRTTAQIRPTPYLLHRALLAFAAHEAIENVIPCFLLLADTPEI